MNTYMNELQQLYTLKHPRRFWWGLLTVAIVSAILLGPWLADTPWLVAIPLVAGGLLVALGELWEELGGKQVSKGTRKKDDTQSPCRRQ
ncbi:MULTISPECIES: hypothetical protein [unclassified Janthinobacterium]|uniref:hypothetical protein n=1 Tax=unclassified Janthinobacterium TaxID=2610881 RepID=UPI00161EDEE6|nr:MULTISPECIES: hypothetical protein [unclassified Janthinobacterium]MBB5607143.1 hypothetical protein [Janthinobacterium sp. S3T4]MBB5612868.1 hypothetical protein [Janthinobacterium sp. S3M3]